MNPVTEVVILLQPELRDVVPGADVRVVAACRREKEAHRFVNKSLLMSLIPGRTKRALRERMVQLLDQPDQVQWHDQIRSVGDTLRDISDVRGPL